MKEILTPVETQEVLSFFDKDFFGSLTPYIADINVTDINCNGRHVWINHVTKGRYRATNIVFSEDDIKALAYRVSNTENVQFNATNPELSADLHDLRFHFTHESFSISGTSVSIRKTPTILRIHNKNMERGKVKYLSKRAIKIIEYFVKSRLNSVFCGTTGAGKTEAAKWTAGFIPDYDRILTIEDTAELHLPQLYPDKDIVALKINEFIGYIKAIKASMRMMPVWMLLSEARGSEIKELMAGASTGAKLITTIHVDDAHQIPFRMLNMFESNELSSDKTENMIYEFIDIGIHIRAEFSDETTRYIDQIVYFELDRATGKRIIHDLYRVDKNRDGTYTYNHFPLPKELLTRLAYYDFYPEWEEEDEEKENN